MTAREKVAALPSIGPVRTGCLCCPPKPDAPPMDWAPHPGFGTLYLKRDGESVEEFDDYCWTVLDRDQWSVLWQGDQVTLGEIEEACAEGPDHDWRLEIHGPLGGAVYQRQGCEQWVPVERLNGFA